MAEETKDTTELQDDEQALLKAYQELQAGSISREEHERIVKDLKSKNKLYLDAILEGRKKVDTGEEPAKTLEEIAKGLSEFKGTNLDFWAQTVEAIDTVMRDVPEQDIVQITGSDGFDELLKIRSVMGKMVEDANGSSDYFRTLYKARIVDSAPRISSDIEQAGGLVNYISTNKN